MEHEMARHTYESALQDVMAEGAKRPFTPGRSRSDIEADIAGITKSLSGSLSNVERIILCGERSALRAELAACSVGHLSDHPRAHRKDRALLEVKS